MFCRHDFGQPDSVSLGHIGRRAIPALFEACILGEYVEPAYLRLGLGVGYHHYQILSKWEESVNAEKTGKDPGLAGRVLERCQWPIRV